jgi:hypothetical protein
VGLGFIELDRLRARSADARDPVLHYRACVSHSVQMHDRYYQEFLDNGFDKRGRS